MCRNPHRVGGGLSLSRDGKGGGGGGVDQDDAISPKDEEGFVLTGRWGVGWVGLCLVGGSRNERRDEGG